MSGQRCLMAAPSVCLVLTTLYDKKKRFAAACIFSLNYLVMETGWSEYEHITAAMLQRDIVLL